MWHGTKLSTLVHLCSKLSIKFVLATGLVRFKTLCCELSMKLYKIYNTYLYNNNNKGNMVPSNYTLFYFYILTYFLLWLCIMSETKMTISRYIGCINTWVMIQLMIYQTKNIDSHIVSKLWYKVIKLIITIMFCYRVCCLIAIISQLLAHDVLMIFILYWLNISIIDIIAVQWNDPEP